MRSQLIEAFRSNWLIITFGLVLIFLGNCILFWNEGRAVYTSMSLDEVYYNATTIVRNDEIEPKYNDRIVHIVGPIVVGEPLTEPEYNIQVQAVKLKRWVQMYQWVEETVEHNYGESIHSVQTDSRTYYYTKEWRDSLIDSRQFNIQTDHQNPKAFPIESNIQVANSIYIGKYELDDNVKEKFNNFIELTSDQRPENPFIKVHLGFYYHTQDIFKPEIGDVRILFLLAGLEGEIYTVVGKLEGNKIVPYRGTYDLDVLLVYPGEMTIDELFNREHRAQLLKTWGWRMTGWMLIFFGVQCTWEILRILLKNFRFLAGILQRQHILIGTMLFSLSASLMIISIAWVIHRPVIGASLFFAAASPFLWLARNVAV